MRAEKYLPIGLVYNREKWNNEFFSAGGVTNILAGCLPTSEGLKKGYDTMKKSRTSIKNAIAEGPEIF